MSWQTVLASLGGVVCLSVAGGLIAVAFSYLRNQAQKARAAGNLPPAGQEPAAPPKVRGDSDVGRVFQAGEIKQTVTRSFDAWQVDKQEEMLVVSMMGDGKEQEAIKLLQLRIERKYPERAIAVKSVAVPVTAAE